MNTQEIKKTEKDVLEASGNQNTDSHDENSSIDESNQVSPKMLPSAN